VVFTKRLRDGVRRGENVYLVRFHYVAPPKAAAARKAGARRSA
jgi:hypothetical protein